MSHMRGWGLLLAIFTPLLILFSWNRLGNESSRINIDRFAEWSSTNFLSVTRPLVQHFHATGKLATTGDVALPTVAKNSGVKSWRLKPDAIFEIELDAKDDGRPVILKFVPVVTAADRITYECVSAASVQKVSRVCGGGDLRSEADIPARLAANARVMQGLQGAAGEPGSPTPAGASVGRVVLVPAKPDDLDHCGYQCVQPQRCVTPRPLACGRLVTEASGSILEITATPQSVSGSSLTTLAAADSVCEVVFGAGARVLRASGIAGRNKLSGDNEYWVHDDLQSANNCWKFAS